MLLLSTLRPVRSRAIHWHLAADVCRYSDGGGLLSAFIGRLWIPSVCSRDVLCAGNWKGGYGACRDSHRHWLSCVRLFALLHDVLD